MILVTVKSSGEIQSLHNDDFPLKGMGPRKIERFTEIVFDEVTETFYVAWPGTKKPICLSMSSFESYNEAVRFEVEWWQQCTMNQVKCDSDEAKVLADRLKIVWRP